MIFSHLQILFYDDRQAIRATDIGEMRFEQICKPRLYKYIKLYSQMRCQGGNGYYDYVRDVLYKENMSAKDYRRIENYELKVLDSMGELQKLIREHNSEVGLCRIMAGPAWTRDSDILIDGEVYHWVDKEEDISRIYSIHKIQGFDLNYGGVVFGDEIYYDTTAQRIEVDKSRLKDNQTKSSGDIEMRRFVLNIYLTFMTRAIKGTYVYVVDENLREYLKSFFDQ